MRVQRICGRIERSEIRVARKLSKLEPKVLLRNFPSVKQIQDSLGSFLLPKNMTDLVSVYFNELFGRKCFLSRHPELTRKSDENTKRDFLFLLGDSGSILNSAQTGLDIFFARPADCGNWAQNDNFWAEVCIFKLLVTFVTH